MNLWQTNSKGGGPISSQMEEFSVEFWIKKRKLSGNWELVVCLLVVEPVLLLMTEILHHLGCMKPKNTGINYQPQLVQDCSHQQYYTLMKSGILGVSYLRVGSAHQPAAYLAQPA